MKTFQTFRTKNTSYMSFLRELFGNVIPKDKEENQKGKDKRLVRVNSQDDRRIIWFGGRGLKALGEREEFHGIISITENLKNLEGNDKHTESGGKKGNFQRQEKKKPQQKVTAETETGGRRRAVAAVALQAPLC